MGTYFYSLRPPLIWSSLSGPTPSHAIVTGYETVTVTTPEPWSMNAPRVACPCAPPVPHLIQTSTKPSSHCTAIQHLDSVFLSTDVHYLPTIIAQARDRHPISPTMFTTGPGSHIHQVTDAHANIITEPADAEPAWRKIRLSLERPYKDDNGQPFLTLLDITPDGQNIYEPFASSFPS